MERVTPWARIWTVVRAVMAVLIAAAVIAQAMRTIGGAASAGRDVALAATNFFSFFTILSNVGAVAALVWAVVWFSVATRGVASARGATSATDPASARDAASAHDPASVRRAASVDELASTRGVTSVDDPPSAHRRRLVEPAALAVVLTCVTTYMIVTGIVYNLLLRGIELPQGATVPWSNEVLHLVGPLFFLVDVFVGPARRALSGWAISWVLVFPLVWITYTLIRGPEIDDPATGNPYWYPYPFLDPNGPGGYSTVFLYVIAIAIGLLLLATAVVLIGRRRGIRPA